MAKYVTPSWRNAAFPTIDPASLTGIGEAIEMAEHPYGVCSSASSSAGKIVTVDFSGTLTLFAGLRVTVKFANSNTASNPTLNVNGTGAVSIKTSTGGNPQPWLAGQTYSFVYDGTNWVMTSLDSYTKGETLSAATASAINAVRGTLPTTPDQAFSLLAPLLTEQFDIERGTYRGDGTVGAGSPKTIYFQKKPYAIWVASNGGVEIFEGNGDGISAPLNAMFALREQEEAVSTVEWQSSGTIEYVTIYGMGNKPISEIATFMPGQIYYVTTANKLTWGDKSVSWYNPHYSNGAMQLNRSAFSYTYFALTK